MKRKWVLLSSTIILSLLMFYAAFRVLSIQPYLSNVDNGDLSWLTKALRNLNLVSDQSSYVVNPQTVTYLLLLLVAVFLTYMFYSLFLESWFEVSEQDKNHENVVFDKKLYSYDNRRLQEELQQTQNLVIAIDDVSLFLNSELLEICSERHFILLCDDVIERFQQAIELVKSDIMRDRYVELLSQLTDNTDVRAKIIYYGASDDIVRQYYLDKSYAADKFLASCISAVKEDNFTIKVVSRNESIIYKSKQLGFSTFQLSSLIEENKEVNVWETEENRGVVH